MVATTHAKIRARQRYGIILDEQACSRIGDQIPPVRIRPGMRKRAVERVAFVHGKAVRLIVDRRTRVIVTVLPTRVPLFLN